MNCFSEHIPTACARVDALKSHGFAREALRLAVAIVRTMKRNQVIAQAHWKQQQHVIMKECSVQGGVASKPGGYASWEGWIGHSLNPIGCLFDTLSEVCLTPEDRSRVPHHLEPFVNEEGSTNAMTTPLPLRYRHCPVPGATSRRETYLTLALEAALIGLGHQRVMPPGLYAQEKALKQEERLISKLQEIELDSTLVGVLCYQADLLMEMGPSSGLGFGIHPETIPMQTFAKFLFLSILPFDSDLAFNIGLRAMRLPILDGISNTPQQPEESQQQQQPPQPAARAPEPEIAAAPANPPAAAPPDQQQQQPLPIPAAPQPQPSNFVMSRYPRWFTLGHIESQQCGLASTMLGAAKGTL